MVKRGPATAVEDGFTFTSPSVYIVYSSISASASCIAMSQTYHTVGGTHVVTRAYEADALSSVVCVNSIGVGQGLPGVKWEPINYSDLYYPIPLTESYRRIDRCFTDRKDNDIWGDWMRKPFISLPKDVSELDPTWTTCSGVAIGAMDPPRALVPADGFDDPPPTVPDSPPSPGPITTSNPNLPSATPGKTVPDPVTQPTPQPQKNSDPNEAQKPAPVKDEIEDHHDPSNKGSADPVNGSPVQKEPSKSPAAPVPLPQQPSPDVLAVVPPNNLSEDSGHDIDPPPPVEGTKPKVQQQSDDLTQKGADNRHDLDSISAAIFPDPPSKPNEKQQLGQKADSPASQEPVPDKPNGNSNSGDTTKPKNPLPVQNAAVSEDESKDDTGSVPAGNPQSLSKDPTKPNQAESAAPGGGRESAGYHEPVPGSVDDGKTAEAGAQQRPDTNESTFDFVPNHPPPTIGGHTIARAPDGGAVIGTATVHPGQGQVIGGTPVSIAPHAVIVGGSTFAVKPPSKPASSAAAPAISKAANGGLIIGTKTVMPGQADIINNHRVSVGSSNVIVDGKSFPFPAVTPAPSKGTINVGGVKIAHGSGNAVVIGGSTYVPGAQITMSGHTVSIGQDAVAVDGIAHSLPTPPPSRSPLLIDGQSVRKASDGNVIVGSSTISPGNQATMNGHVVSVGHNGNIIVDQATYALPKSAGPVQIPDSESGLPGSPLLVDGHAVSKDAKGRLVIGSATVPPGSQTTLAGHVISAASDNVVVDHSTYAVPSTAGIVSIPLPAITLPNGMILTPGASAVTVNGETISVFSDERGFVIDGSTVTFTSSITSPQSIFTVAGQTFTAAPTGFVIGGTSISPGGPAMKISGTVVSLGTAGLQIGSKTMPLTAFVAEPTDLGGFILDQMQLLKVLGQQVHQSLQERSLHSYLDPEAQIANILASASS
ncbi:MAG: hypothetical protein Q9222_003116 [Ikaeria aurantiellina]